MYTNFYTILVVLIILILLIYIIINKNKEKKEYYAGSNVTIFSLPNSEPITNPPYEYHCVYDVPPYTNWCNYA